MKKYSKVFLAPICLILATSACVSFAEMKEELEEFKGQHIDVAIAKLGAPTSEREIPGKKMYAWVRRETRHKSSEKTVKPTEIFGWRETNVPKRTTIVSKNVTYTCRINLYVDASDIVVSYHLNGDLQTCQVYAKRLEDKKKKKKSA
jgi:hypothetical protein